MQKRKLGNLEVSAIGLGRSSYPPSPIVSCAYAGAILNRGSSMGLPIVKS